MKIAIIFILASLSYTLQLQAQNQQVEADSVFIKKGYQLILKDSSLIIYKDTLMLIPFGTKYKVKKSSITKSDEFYDNIEKKSEKKWLTQQVHDALVVSSQNINEDTINFENPADIYKRYIGWNISKISYRQVDVISGNVADALLLQSSGIIKTLNSIKSKTKPNVLKKNTIIKTGDLLDAEILSDNERILRALP